MGLSLLAGCDNEKQQIFTEAEKDLEQGSYEYALDEFTTSVNNGVKPAVSYRGIGICQLRLGNYDDAITAFTSALGEEKVSKSMARDLYLYRATARLQAGYLDDAMADCQVLAQNYEMDADAWFLTGKVALEMDGYDEAASDFEQAYGEDSSYDRAIQIYETYLNKDMEADGTRYLEAVLSTEAKGAEDLCSRGRIYYYMGDYTNAQKELTDASNQGSTEALLVLGMVYGAQSDYANARACTSSISIRSWMIRPGIRHRLPHRDTMDWQCAIWQKETMILPWKISAAELPLLPMMKCRACYLMKL